MKRTSKLVTRTAAAVVAAASLLTAQGDQLNMPGTKPGQGNVPALPRDFAFQVLSVGKGQRALTFPGLKGALLIEPSFMVVHPDRRDFGPELNKILGSVGNAPIYWQRLVEEEKNYFQFSQVLEVMGDGRSKQVDDLRVCMARAETHLREATQGGLTKTWQGASITGDVRELYRPDVDGVAYYEFGVDKGGYIVVATGEHDLPVAHFDDRTDRVTDFLEGQAAKKGETVFRFYKLDSLSYAAENDEGELIAQSGDLPPRIIENPNMPGGFDMSKWGSWRQLKEEFTKTYRPMIENLRMDAADQWFVERNNNQDGPWGPWHVRFAGSHSDQRLYDQWDVNGCKSGCGPVAWMMLFGWADHRAASGDPAWRHRWGLFRQNGGRGVDVAAPRNMNSDVQNAVVEIRGHVSTFCAFGQGATTPWDMHKADRYLSGRTGTTLTTNYNVLGIQTGGLRECARDSIYAGKPAIIGTGWLTHYPLAYGYAWRSKQEQILFWERTVYSRWFYVNQGWGGRRNGWVGAGTWFCGQIFAN